LLFLDPGSGMGKKSGSGINIPDPQHCYILYTILTHTYL
jgi:hypothetical protein